MLKRASLVLVVLLLAVPFCAVAQTYNESPLLAARVAAGELPPVDQRLPENPLVVEPFHEIGEYGGTLRIARPHLRLGADPRSERRTSSRA